MRDAFLIEPPPWPLPPGAAFLRHARYLLSEEYLVKIRAALAELTDEQIWSRPNEASNSIANLLLHLSGNARQWIVAGVGGAADSRVRVEEFAARSGGTKTELMARLEATIADVDAELARLGDELRVAQTDAALQRVCRPQGFSQTVLDAVFHVVEHFSYHTGQIILLAKWHAGSRVRFYDDAGLNRLSNH